MDAQPQPQSDARRVAYLGPAGTFGEIAARTVAPEARHVPLPSHAAVATAVETDMADCGVVAIENSINGSVAETLDILIHDTRLRIQAEAIVPVRHCLVVPPGGRSSDVRVIYSHPQALGQCRIFLEQCFPSVHAEAALSTAEAVRMAVERGTDAAAIATERAAQLYGAEIYARDIQDRDNNVTRFVVLGREIPPPTGHDRTSIAFTFADDHPGLLVSVLEQFASRGINCSKMESRPTKAAFGEYVFLLDCHGHIEDEDVAAAIEALRGLCYEVKVFGSYPRWS